MHQMVFQHTETNTTHEPRNVCHTLDDGMGIGFLYFIKLVCMIVMMYGIRMYGTCKWLLVTFGLYLLSILVVRPNIQTHLCNLTILLNARQDGGK